MAWAFGRGEGQLSTGEIGGRDSFDQVVVIGLSLTIHVDPCSAAAQVPALLRSEDAPVESESNC